jgi:hypothetical protein
MINGNQHAPQQPAHRARQDGISSIDSENKWIERSLLCVDMYFTPEWPRANDDFAKMGKSRPYCPSPFPSHLAAFSAAGAKEKDMRLRSVLARSKTRRVSPLPKIMK